MPQDKTEVPQKDSERTPQQLIDKYWLEFLGWCTIEHPDYRHYSTVAPTFKFKPTELNFWIWFRDNKLKGIR